MGKILSPKAKRNNPVRSLLILMSAVLTSTAVLATETLSWSELPPLPPAPGQAKQPGVASPFVGVDNGALLVAGGANFPDLPPWKGGHKTWWDTIYVFDGGAWHTGESFKLPRALAYGYSVSTPYGIVCVGGSDAAQCYADTFLLLWNREAGKIEITALPPLPEPLANMGGGDAAGVIYVAGGQAKMSDPQATRHAYALDFSKGPGAHLAWERLPDLPGRERILPISFGLTGGNPGFYVFGGRRQDAGEIPKLLTDGFRYDPAAKSWSELGPIAGKPGSNLMAGTSVPGGDSGTYIFGGDDGTVFLPKEELTYKIAQAAKEKTPEGEQKLAKLHQEERNMLENHKGFSRKAYFYDSTTDRWTEAGEMPMWPPVTTLAARLGDDVVIPSGEIRPATRSPVVLKVHIPAGH